MKNVFIGFLLLSASFAIAEYATAGSINFDSDCLLFSIVLIAWILSVLITGKYKQLCKSSQVHHIYAPIVKSITIIYLLCWLFFIFTSLTWNSFNLIQITIGIYFILDSILLLLWFLFNRKSNEETIDFSQSQVSKKAAQKDLDIENEYAAKPINISDLAACSSMFHNRKEILSVISDNINTSQQESGKIHVVNSFSKALEDHKTKEISLLISQIRLNDIRRINKLLLNNYNKILPGGWLFANYRSLENVYESLRKKYPKFLYKLIIPFHFFYFRAFPKIPKLNKIYFFLTKGKNRLISKAEIWGRLHYCGFDVLDDIEVDGKNFVIARKVKTPSEDKNPSYYPVIRLNRVGLNGEIIKARKLRTMSPYSEYIQQKVFELNKLASTGKFEKDFRITNIGKFLRKYWLDELPQLIDWLRGDLKIVGIRAMSLHFFSLYPKEYRELFIKVKPGLIPPLFDEKTADFNEIVETEFRYLKKYIKNSLKTDFEYFYLTFSQIFFKGLRGG